MNEQEIKKTLKESITRLNSIKIGSGWTLGTKKIAETLQELKRSVLLIYMILESKGL